MPKNLLNKIDNYKFFKINFLLLKDILIKYTYLKLLFLKKERKKGLD
jgi:hypothetical protein